MGLQHNGGGYLTANVTTNVMRRMTDQYNNEKTGNERSQSSSDFETRMIIWSLGDLQ